MLLRCIRENTFCMPRRVVEAILAHPVPVILLTLVLAGSLGWYAFTNFAINTDVSEMVSEDLPFRQARKNLDQAFPNLRDNFVAVIESHAPEMAREFQEHLATRLRQLPPEAGLVSVFAPGAGEFFRRNGILLQDLEQVEKTVDSLARIQPFLAPLARELSLPSLLSTLENFLAEGGDQLEGEESLPRLMAAMDRTIRAALAGRLEYLSWQNLMRESGEKGEVARQFVVVRPRLDYTLLNPGKQALETVRQAAHEVGREVPGARVRLTGNVALNSADLRSVESSVGLGFVLSFVAVAVLLWGGLASWRMVLASLSTLLLALVCTLGFAILVVGRFNLISVAFVVLFVGLGIDYSIQYCLGYRDQLRRGLDKRQALTQAARLTGNALILCSLTTAMSFYAFVPTAYVGASELGIIAGTGMLIILVANLTFLPALLMLMPADLAEGRMLGLGRAVSNFPARRPWLVSLTAAVLALVSMALLPWVHFDSNPLNLADQKAEAVLTARDLLRTGSNSPWTLSFLARSPQEAALEAERLAELAEVERVVHLGAFLPDNVEGKLAALEDLEFILPPIPQGPIRVRQCEYKECRQAVESFGRALQSYLAGPGQDQSQDQAEAVSLGEGMGELAARLQNRQEGEPVVRLLEQAMLRPMAVLLESLRDLRRAEPFGAENLPPELVEQYVSPQGVLHVQVFPVEDISQPDSRMRFVAAVRAVHADVTGPAVAALESGQAIIQAFVLALAIAMVLISAFLLLVLRQALTTAVILMPLMLAILYSLGATVVLGIPFNFANIIVVPLILGIGVDYSLHLVHRYRIGSEPTSGLLETSTARAVLFSALTTVVSFVSLAFSSHSGMSGMGVLLTVCIGLVLLAALMILPAVLTLAPGLVKREHGQGALQQGGRNA